MNTAPFYDVVEQGDGSRWTRCRICRRPGPHPEPLLAAEVEGRARMAAGRLEAGRELDEIDRAALEAFPSPRSSFRMTP